MAYAAQQDLIDRFGEAELKELADRDGDDVIDADVVAKALADADELINTYIAPRYALPLAAVPAALVKLACDIARYFLFKDSPTETVAENYKAARSLLRDIADGRAALDAAGAEPEGAPGNAEVTSSERVFSRESMKGF